MHANLRPDAFSGTAQADPRYRPRYPRVLLDDLLARAAPTPHAALPDLACGPARVALDLASEFDAIVAIDPPKRSLATRISQAAFSNSRSFLAMPTM